MIVKEKVIPEPQPKGLLLLLRRVLVLLHIVEVARVDHRCAADVELILRAAIVFTDAVQEIVELHVQLLHLDALVLLDVLDRKAIDLLPSHALRQTKPPRDVEHLEIRIELAKVNVVVARLVEIGQKGVHPRKIVLRMTFQRTAVNVCIGVAKEKCQIVDADEEMRKRVIAPLNDGEEILNAVPVRAEVLIASPAPCRRTQIAFDQRACDKDICTSVLRIKTLD